VVNVPSVPEIITVNSEALQTQIRDLLPSQNGFGSELQASNVIMPIIDLTSAAEGSTTPEFLQTALAFGSQTAFSTNTSSVIINNTGFYRVIGTASISANQAATSNPHQASFDMTDGSSTKSVWALVCQPQGASDSGIVQMDYDFIVFLRAGDSLSAVCKTNQTYMAGSTRQVATGSGTLVPPNGFPL